MGSECCQAHPIRGRHFLDHKGLEGVTEATAEEKRNLVGEELP